MCDELKQVGDILACYVISNEGKLLGASYGKWLPLDEALKKDFSEIAAVVWGALERVTSIGGSLETAAISFENFKIVGFPIQKTDMAILLTVEEKVDSDALKSRVQDSVSYWLKTNHWID
jgi:hypothetical protein